MASRCLALALTLTFACSVGGGAAPSTTSASPTSTSEASTEGLVVETLVGELPAGTGGVSIDEEGNLYVADFGAGAQVATRVYRISPSGEVAVHVDDPRIAKASGNYIGPDGNLYQSSFQNGRIFKITPDGSPELVVTGLIEPVGLVVDDDGNIFVNECTPNRLRKIAPDGRLSVLSQDPSLDCPTGLALAPDGTLYVSNWDDGSVLAVSESGEAELLAQLPGGNNGHLEYWAGRLIVLDRGSSRVYSVSLEGEAEPIAGSGELGSSDGPALAAAIGLPNALAVDEQGVIYLNHATDERTTALTPTAVRVIKPAG